MKGVSGHCSVADRMRNRRGWRRRLWICL